MVRRITRDLHTHRLIESLSCESCLRAPLHRKHLPDCSYTSSNTRDIETTFLYRLQPRLVGPPPSLLDIPPSLLPSGGGGGSTSFSKIGTSVRSMFGTQTLLSMRRFIEDAEKKREKETGVKDAELEAMDSTMSMGEEGAQKEAIQALRMLFDNFEDQIKHQDEVDEGDSSDS